MPDTGTIHSVGIAHMQQLAAQFEEPFAIAPSRHAAESGILRNLVRNEYFFFTVNVATQRIENVAGVSRWLGYADSQFSFWDYAQCVHAAHCFSWMSVGAKLM